MNAIIGELGKSNKMIDLIKNIENEKSPIVLSGLSAMGMIQILAGISQYSKKPILIITYNEIESKRIYDNMKYFSNNIIRFPKKEIVTYDYIAESKELPYERIQTLNEIVTNKNKIVIATIESLMQKIPKKEVLYKNQLDFKVGQIHDLEKIKKILVDLGYVRYELIDGRGQFSVRGGILDISVSTEIGIRIEFWGDEIDSIRTFNIVSQRSIKQMDKITINPAHEYILDNSIDYVCSELEKLANNSNEKNYEIINKDISQIREGNYVSKIDKYFDLFYKESTNALEYIKKQYLVVVDEESKIVAREKNIENDTHNLLKSLAEKDKMIPEALLDQFTYEQIANKLLEHKMIYVEKNDNVNQRKLENFKFNYRDINYYKNDIDTFFEDIQKALNEKKQVYVLLENKEKAKKMEKILVEKEIFCKLEESLDKTIIVKSREKYVTITVGKVENGFECYDLNQLIISGDNLVDAEKTRKKAIHSEFKEAEKVVFADLKLGDVVVHRNYGIGIYIGVNTIKADGIIKDYIKLKYKDNDILYVPTNQMEMVRKYIGGDTVNPKLHKLGGKEWKNTTAKLKKNLREIAQELIELYAKREKIKGYAFSKDTPWQQEFEGKFPYQETNDQLRCIEEVKHDMELDKPMDRLLCGDVGYGKTEVALRAAFKAVMDNKQVIYLAPTTVLAEQQYKEFKDRMKDYPIKVEVLNRFKTPKQQKDIIKKLRLGEIDIIVGTHRVLSKDVEFSNLGLLVIDEEHRFGVKDKEKIKQYKSTIDVLTMTATPIPRTLHMSIVGVRDMSVIYEPPSVRKPVQTYVLEHDLEMLQEAITRELERDGQVFYLYNKVDDIELKQYQIEKLVPEAKASFAHGQMSGKEIEAKMEEFVNRDTNVLICTTILESGIDIPNANTIIVENADKMGLAQLYQIRGRVGRGDKQAYAYITYKRDKMLSEVADKRLKAIKEFTEFGSGFKIAMRDLEIRGAGSLLGEIQSGHFEDVGYETYCKILDEVVKEVKGIEIEQELDVQIDLNVSSYISEEYIEDQNQKIEVYQNIALCKNENDIANVIDEIIDRFGNMPPELENLIDVARIKYLAKLGYVEKISSKRGIGGKELVVFTIYDKAKEKLAEKILTLVERYGNKIKFSPGIKNMITLELTSNKERVILKEVTDFLKHL